ncbi:hypothetical protein JW968_06065 [Candidatus Woesearchaeota archaeon]|nr:hypothetical protein [Candidatus Woesearchaeota archaeon]
MDFAERNRNVAINRWKRIHERERRIIGQTDQHTIMKSALCGFLAGDGSVQIRKEKDFLHHQLDFFPDDPLMLRKYCEFLYSVYKKRPKIKQVNGFSTVRVSSKTIVKDLIQHADFGLYTWNFPEKLFKVEGAKEAWVNAFFASEAYIGPQSIKVQTVNHNSMRRLSILLDSMGIENRYYEYAPKNQNHNLVAIIHINKKKAKYVFATKIGIWHSKKQNALRKALDL